MGAAVLAVSCVVIAPDSDPTALHVVHNLPGELAYTQRIENANTLAVPSELARIYNGLVYTPVPLFNCSYAQSFMSGLNVTRFRDLPPRYSIIALIPMDNCTLLSIAQAQTEGAQAVVLFDNDVFPTISYPLQNMMSAINVPVYGISGPDASALINASSQYSGAISTIPNADSIEARYGPKAYVRLAMTIDTGMGNSFPSLWLFLLVILIALGIIIASTSLSMHISQYRARQNLRRRIMAGEINLETLGIKRITVPPEKLHDFPVRTYDGQQSAQEGDGKEEQQQITSQQQGPSDPAPVVIGKHINNSTCVICLEDYTDGETQVRELPCGHTFHPECIDPFLLQRSSLCPLCKRSVLPKGFLPSNLVISNATIARERRLRGQRQEEAAGVDLAAMAVTQAEEDAALGRRGRVRRVIDAIFPVFLRDSIIWPRASASHRRSWRDNQQHARELQVNSGG